MTLARQHLNQGFRASSLAGDAPRTSTDQEQFAFWREFLQNLPDATS